MKKRKPNRKRHFDYSSPGFYFVTLCVKKRRPAFGRVDDGNMILSDAGKIADECWNDLPAHYRNCRLDYYVIMPDHCHGIVEIADNVSISGPIAVPVSVVGTVRTGVVRTGLKPVLTISAGTTTQVPAIPAGTTGTVPTGDTDVKSHGLPEIMRGFKTFSSRKIHEKTNIDFHWQKSYHDRIIRNERELKNIRRYIENNVFLWQLNEDNREFYDEHIRIP